MTSVQKPVNVEDYRSLAQRRLPKIIFDYLEGGADDEIGMKHNREVFERYRLMPRRLVDVSKRDTGIELFGGVSVRLLLWRSLGREYTFKPL